MDTAAKEMQLETYFKENPTLGLGFSGGVDSAYLLYAGLRTGATVKAYYVKTQFQPAFELQDAYRLAADLGTEITVLTHSVLDDPCIVKNSENRCYFCKSAIFGLICKQAASDGFSTVIDGTNASDDVADRPGMAALTQLDVVSPLRVCGITKDEVRQLSKAAGLSTWNKPAYACLATRIETGVPITQKLLTRVEVAEDALFQLGYSDFRVRVFHDAARLQFPQAQIEKAVAGRKEIAAAIKPHFSSILLDLEGR